MMKKWILLLLFFANLGSCSIGNQVESEYPFTETPPENGTALTITPHSQNMYTHPTDTITLTEETTSHEQVSCVQIRPVDSLLGIISMGTLVEVPERNILVFWAMETGEKGQIEVSDSENTRVQIIESTPDKRFLIYSVANDSNANAGLFVTSGDNEFLQEVPLDQDEMFLQVINNHTLGIVKEFVAPIYSVKAYDFLTSKEEILYPDVKDLFSGGDFYSWDLRYSPDIGHIAYLDVMGSPRIWDIANEKIVWKTDGFYPADQPQWSPSGDQIAICDGNRYLHRILNDGTDIPFPIPDYLHPENITFSPTYSWSPDGRYLASWVYTISNERIRLLILDTTTNETINYCIYADNGYQIIWAPERHALITSTSTNNLDGSYKLDGIYLDVDNEVAYSFPYDQVPYQWILSTHDN